MYVKDAISAAAIPSHPDSIPTDCIVPKQFHEISYFFAFSSNWAQSRSGEVKPIFRLKPRAFNARKL